MTRHIYALLVGIDEYMAPVPELKGCVNDVTAVKAYLEGRVAARAQLHLHTLFNHEATYQAIVNGFREHLCQAGNEDVAFFYYAGHGSQEQSPEVFWATEPDHLQETIVCVDSRGVGGKDLADKELGTLIAEVTQKNPHIAIFMDCCHSGSGTRGNIESEIRVRQAPRDQRVRSLDSYLFSVPDIEQRMATSSSVEPSTGWRLPKEKHIFLSACRNSELAKEVNIAGENRGAFSYFLLDTLTQANGSLTYRDLFKRTHALVSSKVTAQSPQIEAAVLGELDQPFLGGAVAERTPYFTVSYHKKYGWVMDGGAIHGMPQPDGNDTTVVALFPFDCPVNQLRDLAIANGEAQVLKVMPQLSQVQIKDIASLTPEMTFKAVITSLPLPPKGVIFAGEETGVELARAALLTANSNQPSLYVREVAESAEFKVLAREGHYWLTRPADERPLVAQIQGYTPANASLLIQRLEQIARWMKIVELASPATSQIRPDAVQMLIYQDGKELQDAQIRLEYRQENGLGQPPIFKIKLKNTHTEALYCALLDLTDRYAVDAGLFEAGGIWLNPGEEVWALGDRPIYPTVPEKLWKQGITETRDILKLIVSTTEFDARLLEQAELDLPSLQSRNVSRGQGTLNRLMNRVQRRELRAEPEEEVYDDWITSQITITTVRPQPTTPISRDGMIALGTGVQLLFHPTLSASARLTTVAQSTRDLGSQILPPLLREGMEPFQFMASRGNDPGLSVLELSQVSDQSQVTPKAPLKLLVDTPLGTDEQLLPISYDGEFFLPLGRAHRTADNKTEIILERLTDPVSEGSRSLSGSIRIFFQKVVTKQLGLEFEYPILAIADVSPDETLTYTKDIQQVKARVAQAQRIVLYIHGIIGDTQSMVPSLQRAKLSDRYDLILTFDYENLNTPNEENARLLKQRLAAVGLGENHGKMLHVVAHSIGGLVSRWLIEREGGNQIIQHLFMLGTPNAGSPWATVEDWALTTLSIGLNGFSKFAWSAPIVGILLKAMNRTIDRLETIDVALDQMRPNSEFLQTLATSGNPGIPYTIVAGNVSITPAALQPEANQPFNPLERLTQKLFHKAVAVPFFGQTNDIAVTVQSIKSVAWEGVQIHDVGCDHLVYFSDSAGLAAFSNAVIQAQEQSHSVSVR